MSLRTGLVWWWDLDSAGATITDQHSGLVLTRIGTTTTVSGGAPDGGNCISVGDAAGKYRNSSVAKTISYENGFSANIWAYSTAASTIGNWLLSHRNNPENLPDNRYFQMVTQRSTGGEVVSVFDQSGASRFVQTGFPQTAINQWSMFTIVDDGTETKLYRNGELVGTSTTTLGTRNTGSAPFAVGGDSWNSSVSFEVNHRGRVSMSGVWDRPLTISAIAWLYNGGDGRRYSALPNYSQTRRRRYAGSYGL